MPIGNAVQKRSKFLSRNFFHTLEKQKKKSPTALSVSQNGSALMSTVFRTICSMIRTHIWTG